MKARLLRALNPVGLVFLLLFAYGAQSTLFSQYPLTFFQPDFLIFIIAWIAMKRDFFEGGVLCLVFSKIAEIHSASPSGLLMITYMALYLIVRLFYRSITINDAKRMIGIALGSTIFVRIMVLILLALFGRVDNQATYTLRLIAPILLIHSLIALPVFRFLLRFDQWTLKDPRSFHRMEQDFYLDEEWI